MKMKHTMRGLGLLMAVVMLLTTLPLGGVVWADDDPIVIACCGDSLTVSYMSTGGKTYPNQMQKLLGSRYKVQAFGVNGSSASTTANFNGNPSGYALQPEYKKSIALNPDVVILTIGSNDAKVTNWQNGRGAAQFEEDYRALIASYQALESHPVIILGISPSVQIEGTDHNAILNKYVLEVNAIQRKVAEELGLPTVDIHALLEGRDDYFDKDEEMSGGDGCHPNNSGYGAIAEACAKAVRTYAAGEDDTSIIDFTLAGEAGRVNGEDGTVYVTVPYASSLTYTPDIVVPDGVTVSPEGEQDFSKPVTYTVTARDGVTTQSYTVYATMGPRIKVACVGDSITRGGFPTNLQTLLGESYEVKNFGENSTTVSKNGLKETGDGRGAYIYHNVYTQSLQYQPDVVFILLGANDSKEAGKNPEWVTNWTAENKANFKSDLSELVQSYRDLDRHPLVVIATPTKPHSNSWGVSAANVEKEIVPLEKEVAEELDCPFIDLFTLFAGHTEWLGGDQLHPNAAGNEQIATAYADFLKPLKLNTSAVPLSLSLIKKPYINDFIQGQDMMTMLGYCSVGLTYSNGTVAEVRITEDMLSKPDLNAIGPQTLTVSYMGFTTTLDILIRGCGDANSDGVVDTGDARLVLQYAAEIIDVTQLDSEACDVNGDGVVDTGDARMLLQYAAEIITEFPAFPATTDQTDA